MPTPGKPFEVLKGEGKSHRTKAELRMREKAENSLLTGKEMRAWNSLDKTAKKEFNRIKKMLKTIGKNDALYESVINRYCLLKSECDNYINLVEKENQTIDNIEKEYADGKIEFLDYVKYKQNSTKTLTAMDRQLQQKRKMMLDIEKENIMTIASVLRTIPKTIEKDKKPKSGMNKFIQRDGTGGIR